MAAETYHFILLGSPLSRTDFLNPLKRRIQFDMGKTALAQVPGIRFGTEFPIACAVTITCPRESLPELHRIMTEHSFQEGSQEISIKTAREIA